MVWSLVVWIPAIPENESDVLGVPIESQTTNHQLTTTWFGRVKKETRNFKPTMFFPLGHHWSNIYSVYKLTANRWEKNTSFPPTSETMQALKIHYRIHPQLTIIFHNWFLGEWKKKLHLQQTFDKLIGIMPAPALPVPYIFGTKLPVANISGNWTPGSRYIGNWKMSLQFLVTLLHHLHQQASPTAALEHPQATSARRHPWVLAFRDPGGELPWNTGCLIALLTRWAPSRSL